MKKVIFCLVFVFIINLGFYALSQQQSVGCPDHCDAVMACCKKYKGQDCETKFKNCQDQYANTPSDLCPNIRVCH